MKEKKEFKIKKQTYVPPCCICSQVLEEGFICTSVTHKASATTEENWEEERIPNDGSDNWIEF